MSDRKPLAAVLDEADSLPTAVVALATEIPELTVAGLLAAERAEMMEVSWLPDRSQRGVSHLVALAEMLRPLAAEHAELPLHHAFPMLAEAGHPGAAEIATALDAAGAGMPPQIS